MAATLRADQRVGLVEEGREIAVQDPGLLNKLELPCDVGIEADEQKSSLPMIVLPRIFDRRPIFPAATQNAVVVGGVEKRLRGSLVLRKAVARIASAHVRTQRAAAAARIVTEEPEVVLRPLVLVCRQQPAGTQQVAVDVAAHDALGEPLRGDVRRGGVVRSDLGRAIVDRIPERRDVLPKLAHDQITTVETEVEEALGRAFRLQPLRAPPTLHVVLHERPGRLLVMRIGVTQQDVPEGNSVPGVLAWRAVRQ